MPKSVQKASWEGDLNLHQQSAGAHLHVGRPRLRPMFPARAEASCRLRRVCPRTRFKPRHSAHDKSLPLVPTSPRHLRCTRTSSENHLKTASQTAALRVRDSTPNIHHSDSPEDFNFLVDNRSFINPSVVESLYDSFRHLLGTPLPLSFDFTIPSEAEAPIVWPSNCPSWI